MILLELKERGLMTAEIAIMNKTAIALAADSAVTSGSKIYDSVNKLFMLSKYEPIGIMIYGNANFMGVPWETIIKLYRDKLDNNKESSSLAYAKKFIDFIKTEFSGSEDDQKNNFQNLVRYKFLEIWRTLVSADPDYIVYIMDKIFSECEDEWNNADGDKRQVIITTFIIKDKCKKICKELNRRWTDFPEKWFNDVFNAYKDIIEEELLKRFDGLPISEDSFKRLKDIAVCTFYESISGVVIAGFGKDEIFPSIHTHTIAGIVNGELKYQLTEKESIEINRKDPAWIIPFAQHEMVDAFLEGVTPKYHGESEKYLKKIFDDYPKKILDIIDEIDINGMDKATLDKVKEKIKEIEDWRNDLIQDYNNDMSDKKEENFYDILSAVMSLPKDELASMAESLVHITSLKRKFTYNEVESVGGAIDVAIISKGDGFVWIKRKHYFDRDLNHHFFKTYYNDFHKEKK